MKKVSFVRLSLIAIFLIQIVVILNIRPWKNAEKQNALINWDVTSYYSYLPAVFVHQDLKFNFLKNSTTNYAEKHQFWPETAPNGNKVIKTTMGMSILYLPFFLVANAFAILSPWPRIKYISISQLVGCKKINYISRVRIGRWRNNSICHYSR